MRSLLATLALIPVLAIAGDGVADPPSWAQWRGPLGTGVAPASDPPVEWNEELNVRWKTAVPGLGQSSPVVWGDRIFLTTAIPFGEPVEASHTHADGAHHNMASRRKQKFVVLAVDRGNGEILWERAVREGLPFASTHESGSWASNSAVRNLNQQNPTMKPKMIDIGLNFIFIFVYCLIC